MKYLIVVDYSKVPIDADIYPIIGEFPDIEEFLKEKSYNPKNCSWCLVDNLTIYNAITIETL